VLAVTRLGQRGHLSVCLSVCLSVWWTWVHTHADHTARNRNASLVSSHDWQTTDHNHHTDHTDHDWQTSRPSNWSSVIATSYISVQLRKHRRRGRRRRRCRCREWSRNWTPRTRAHVNFTEHALRFTTRLHRGIT